MIRRLAVAAALAAFLTGAQAPLFARTGCTNADLNGAYAASSEGLVSSTIIQSFYAGPHSRVGTMIFDGNGNFKVNQEYSVYNGYAYNAPYTGTYTVNADCTFTFKSQLLDLTKTFLVTFYTTATYSGTLATDLREFKFMLTAPTGNVVSGVATKIRMNGCSAASFAGDYEFDMNGYFIGGPLSGPFKRIGKVSSDGLGAFSATTTADYGGQIVPESFTGTYTIDANCTMKMLHQLNGVDVTLIGPVADNGNAAYVIVSGAALAGAGQPVLNAITGSLKAQ